MSSETTEARGNRVAGTVGSDHDLPPPGECNALALRKAMRRLSNLYDDILAETGLRTTQYSMLTMICRSEQPTMSELASHLVVDRSALSENLKPLIRAGYVETIVDSHDRRSRRVRLTPAGQAKLATAIPVWRRAQGMFETSFGAKPAADLRETLDDISTEAFADRFNDSSARNGHSGLA